MDKYVETKYYYQYKNLTLPKKNAPTLVQQATIIRPNGPERDLKRLSNLNQHCPSYQVSQYPRKFVQEKQTREECWRKNETSCKESFQKKHKSFKQVEKSQQHLNAARYPKKMTLNINKFRKPLVASCHNQKKDGQSKSFKDYLEQARQEALSKIIIQYHCPYKKRHQQIKQTSNSKLGLRDTQDTLNNSSEKFRVSNHISARDFLKLKKLGSGKNGQVYCVVHKKTGFICAMKIIKKKDINHPSKKSTETVQKQLLREIKIQMFFSHPNLIQLYGVFSDKQNVYLLQQLGTDGQLYDLMKKKEKFSEESTALISRELAKGLDALHKKDVIHRDVKPENVVLTYGISKLCDFGWSIYCPKQLRSTLCGTPLYFSPQVLIGQDYNDKIDIWALGTLTYQVYTGQNPFLIRQKDDLKRIVTDQLVFDKAIPNIMKDFFSKILAKSSKSRPSASSVLKLDFLLKYSQLQTSEQLSRL